MPIQESDFLQQFTAWGNGKKNALLFRHSNTLPLDEELNQGMIVCKDLKYYVRNFSGHCKYEAASLIQCIATMAISPFAVIAELYRSCNGSIHVFTCLKNICIIPKHILFSIFNIAFLSVRVVDKTVSAGSIGVGFLAWHSGERMVRLINGGSNTVLSNKQYVRDIVYDSIGLTLLSAATVFVPVAPIQMIALPIILGSIYGTANNQFTIRECPEYYTMGHYYDGTNLQGHAVKTNHLIIKPIVTGCYATTMVTKIAGVVLAAVGTLPYTAAVLPIPYAATMIAGVSMLSLVTGHVFSSMKKKSVQRSLDAYAALIDIQWTDDHRNKTWAELKPMLLEAVDKKRIELASNPQELATFNKKLEELVQINNSNTFDSNMPIKYIIGWHANSTRNLTGYIFAGGGTLAIAVSSIFLRIFAL